MEALTNGTLLEVGWAPTLPLTLMSAEPTALPWTRTLFLGFSSQWIRQDINGVVHTGLLWDTGILAEVLPGFSLGAALKNLGVDSGGYNLPTEFGVGVAYPLFPGAGECPFASFGAGRRGVLSRHEPINLGLSMPSHQNYFLRWRLFPGSGPKPGGFGQGLGPGGRG